MDQIVQVDVHGEIFVNADGDGFHQRQMLQHDAVAAGHTGSLRRSVRFHMNSGVRGIVRCHGMQGRADTHRLRGRNAGPR